MSSDPVGAPRKSRKPGVVVMLLGLAMMVGGAVLIGVRVVPDAIDTVGGPVRTVPFAQTLHLDGKTYVVYEQVGTSSGGFGVDTTFRDDPRLRPGDVEVTDGTDAALSTSVPSFAQTLTLGATVYEGAVEFTVPREGDYTIRVTGEPGTRFVVAPSLGSTFARAVPGVLLGGAGFVAAIVGLVLVLVASRRPKPAVATPLPPAGWYDDPQRPGSPRWWDGRNWAP